MSSVVFFFILAAFIIYTAWFVVTAHNLFRSAIGLVAVLIGIAGMYLLIDAQFLAAAQITVYVGAIVVLIVFAILLVSDVTQKHYPAATVGRKVAAGLAAVMLFGTLVAVILGSGDLLTSETGVGARSATVRELGLVLLSPQDGGFVLPFEAISMLLLAALIGAITIAKPEPRPDPAGGQPSA